jgi:hypothetical protein
MTSILNKRLISKGNWINSPDLIGTIVLDADVLPSDIGNYLPDNSTNKYDREFGLITSGSTVKLIMTNYWYLCQFNAEIGTYDSTVERMSGQWKVMSKIDYIF